MSNNYVRDKTEFYGENLMVRGMYVFLKIFFFFVEHGSLVTIEIIKLICFMFNIIKDIIYS